MLHSLYVSYYSLQSYSSSTGDDATQSIRFLLFPVELQQLYRRCYTVYTFPTIPCGATVALQEMLHSLTTFPTIPCRATVALQEMLHSLYVSYYSLQSYSSSTGDATQSIRFLLLPVVQEILHPLYVSYYSLQSYSSSTGDATQSIRFLELLQMLQYPCRSFSYYSLQSYSSSTGDATQPVSFLLFPAELQQLYRRCYAVYTFPTIPCRDAVALLQMLHSLYVSYYSLQSYRRCYSSSTGDATQSIRFLLFPVEIQQLHRRCYRVYTLLLYRRCYTVYTFPTIPCRATVALQEMLHSLYVSYYSLQSYSSSTGDATQSIRFLLFPVDSGSTGDATQSIRSLQSYSSPTGDATQSIRFLLFPVELQQPYRRCYTVYTFPTIPCRATVALQEMLHSLNVSYYSLQSYSSTTRDATQSVDLQWLYRRCYTVYTFPTIPCRAKVALQEMLHSLYVSYYSLQRYSSSTGDATQSIRFLLFHVELQQLYRRCYTVYTFPAIPCRATVALQEMHATQSIYTFPTIPSRATVALQEMHATQSIRFLLFPVELQQLYKRCYTVYTFPTIPCRATVALQEMLHSLYVSFLFPVELQQLYRRCYTVYTFPTIPCRATVALQEHV